MAGTGYGYVARGITPAAANYQVFENCAGPGGCKQEIARGSFAWRSARADVNRIQVYVQCDPACQKLSGGEAAAVRVTRADIALTDNARADRHRRAHELDVRLGRRRSAGCRASP